MAESQPPAALQIALAPTQDYRDPSYDRTTPSNPPSPATTTDDAQSLIGQRVGQYRVKRELGRGGMGIVYEAIHEEIGQRAALKTLHGDLSANPQFKKRFLNEMRSP